MECDPIRFFFFQAEDGIRYHCVTGVQTCALPICPIVIARPSQTAIAKRSRTATGRATGRGPTPTVRRRATARSEERRVGKECRCGGGERAAKKKREEVCGGGESQVHVS